MKYLKAIILIVLMLNTLMCLANVVEYDGKLYEKINQSTIHDDTFIYSLFTYECLDIAWGHELTTACRVYSCEIVGLYQDCDSLRIPEYVKIVNSERDTTAYLVTAIHEGALSGTNAISIVLPSYMIVLKGAFSGCSKLRDIYFTNRIPENMEMSSQTFDMSMYNECTIHVPKGREDAYGNSDYFNKFDSVLSWEGDFQENGLCYSIQSNVYYDNVTQEVLFKQDEIEIWGLLDNGDGEGMNVLIPEHVIVQGKACAVTSIGDYAFANTNLVSIDAPNTIEYVGAYSFSNTRLKEFVWKWTTVHSIEGDCICGSRHKNKLGGGINRGINQGTFAGSDIESFYLMTPLYMYSEAFANCKNLKHIYIYDENGYAVHFCHDRFFNELAFLGTDMDNCTLHVPSDKNTYEYDYLTILDYYEQFSPQWTIQFKAIEGWSTWNDPIVNETYPLAVPSVDFSLVTSYLKKERYYSLSGFSSEVPFRGINIFRMNDGSVRKFIKR